MKTTKLITMKTTKLIITTVAAALALAAGNMMAQTTTNATGGTTVTATNAPAGWYQPLLNIYQNIASATNIAGAPFAMTLTSGAKSGTWGGGVIGLYNVTDYLGTGIGIYYLGVWYEFNGTVQLQYPLPLTTWLTLAPFVAAGIGTSFAGAGTANGDVDIISQLGVNADLFKLGNWQIGAGGFFGNITGAGQFSGNDAGGFVKLSRGF
jgi:hypothetical protein